MASIQRCADDGQKELSQGETPADLCRCGRQQWQPFAVGSFICRNCGYDRNPNHGVPLFSRTSKWNKIEHRLFSFISMN